MHTRLTMLSGEDEVIDVASDGDSNAGKARSRPTRRAAVVATEKMQQTNRGHPAAEGSDEEEGEGESDNPSGSSDEALDSGEVDGAAVASAQPLSAYEIERQQNIASNNAELSRLGLAGGSQSAAQRSTAGGPKPKRACSDASSSRAPVARWSRRAEPQQARDAGHAEKEGDDSLSDSDADAEPVNESVDTRQGVRTVHRQPRAEERAAAKPATSAPTTDEALSLFEAIVPRDGGSALAKILRYEDLARMSTEMRLGLPEEGLRDMIDLFDASGKCGLTFTEFASVVQMAGNIRG